MRNKKWVIGLFMLLLLGSLVLADNTTFYLRPKLGNDIRASATIDYNITLAENANCTGISLSRQTSITTDKYGIAPFPLNISNLNGYPLYVCEYQDNLGITLRKAHELGAGLFGILTVSKTANISRGLYLDNGLLRAANISVQNLNLSGNATSLNDFNLYLPSNRAINISIGGTQYSYLNSTENTFNVPIVLTGSFSDKNNTYSLFKGTGQGIGTVIDTAQLDVPLGASIVLSIENKTAIIVNGTTGYVGINNSNPQELLHVGNSTQASAQAGHGILMSNTGQAWVSARDPAGPTEAGVMAIGTVGYVGTWTSHQLIFRTGDTDRWNIDTNGNLGSNTAGGVLRFGAGDAITATEYEVARDADATNQLHFNVPTGATYEFSVNDVASVIVSAGGTINSGSTGNSNVILQNQVFTPSATHNAVEIAPSWASENFVHTALRLQPVQNGANTQALRGLSIVMTKATGATVLDIMTGLYFNSPAITGTVTNNEAIRIEDQTSASATTSRGITFVTTGVANSIWWGASALQYANAANNIRFMDSTNGEGIEFILTNSNLQTINTVGGSLNLSTGNVSRMSINGTTGFVGINNSNPQELLHVGNSTQASAQAGHGILMSNTGQAWVSARDPAGPTEAGVMAIGTTGYVGTWTSHQLVFRTGDTDRWNIDTNGNLGSNTAGGVLRFGAGDAITATEYELSRDADATNQLHFNVPTGAGFEWSINDVPAIRINSGGFILSSSGDATTPSLAYIADTDTGMYRQAEDVIGFTTGGVTRVIVNNTNLNVTLPRIYFAPATVITFADRVNFSNAFSFNTSHIIPAVNNATILGVQGVINASESSPFAFKEIIVNRVSAQHNLTAWIFNLPISTYPIGVGGATHSTSFRINDTAWFIGSVQVGSTNTYAAMNIQLGRDQNPSVSLPDQITIAGVFSQTENVSLSNGNVFIDNDKNRICLGCNGLNVAAMTQNQASETIISDVVNITTLIQIDSAGNHNFTMQQVVCVNGTGYLGVCTTQPNATGGCNCQSRVIT